MSSSHRTPYQGVSRFTAMLAIITILFFVVITLSATSTHAQIDCAPILQTIQQSLEKKCSAISDDQICLANLPVTVNYKSPATQPADGNIPLADVETIVTDSQDLTKNEWGVALLKAKLALPQTPDQDLSANFVLYGQAFLGKVDQGSSLSNLSDMSALHFSTGSGVGQMCPGLPSSGLFVQSPVGQSVRFTVNGADLTIQGSAVLKAPPGNLNVFVLDGQINLVAVGTPHIASAGQMLSLPLGGDVGLDVVGTPGPAFPVDDQQINKAALCTLISGTGTVSWCPISSAVKAVLPAAGGEIIPSATLAPSPVGCTVQNGWPIYVVSGGDTLSAIAQRVSSSVDVLAKANCLAGNAIFVGQQLHVPLLPPSHVDVSGNASTLTLTLVPTATYKSTIDNATTNNLQSDPNINNDMNNASATTGSPISPITNINHDTTNNQPPVRPDPTMIPEPTQDNPVVNPDNNDGGGIDDSGECGDNTHTPCPISSPSLTPTHIPNVTPCYSTPHPGTLTPCEQKYLKGG